MKKNQKIILGLLGAVTAGVAIGMLLAPEKGKDIRKKIKKTAEKWGENMHEFYEKGKGKFTKSDLKNKAEAMKETLS